MKEVKFKVKKDHIYGCSSVRPWVTSISGQGTYDMFWVPVWSVSWE
jgi:hypothetical protein